MFNIVPLQPDGAMVKRKAIVDQSLVDTIPELRLLENLRVPLPEVEGESLRS
jgi:hypothetical protein